MKTKGYTTLRGTRILLEAPELKDNGLKLDNKTEDAMRQEFAVKLGRLKVYAVGTDVDDIKEGDEVYLQSYALQGAEKLKVADKVMFMVNERDIAIIW